MAVFSRAPTTKPSCPRWLVHKTISRELFWFPAGFRPLSLHQGVSALVCWERQVPPEVVELAVRASGRRVIAFAAEHVNIPQWVWRPVSRASARSDSVIRVVKLKVVERRRDVSPGLIDVYRALPPNPLAGAQLILPYVVQEAGGLCGVGTISEASKKEQI